jgi:glycosyltransferase involved in cell wall biosynthesis
MPSGLPPRIPDSSEPGSTTVGYFARICPEKGAFRFLDAAAKVLPARPDLKMVMGGFLPEQHRKAFESRLKALQSIVGDRFSWAGSPADRDEKFRLIQSFDWLCVPTEYHEPKGLYVLEAALAGVPSLVPAHGAFPERIAALSAGQLYDPADPNALESELMSLQPLRDSALREQLQHQCLLHHGMIQTGTAVLQSLQAR